MVRMNIRVYEALDSGQCWNSNIAMHLPDHICLFRQVNWGRKSILHIASRLRQPPPCMVNQLPLAFRIARFDYYWRPFIWTACREVHGSVCGVRHLDSRTGRLLWLSLTSGGPVVGCPWGWVWWLSTCLRTPCASSSASVVILTKNSFHWCDIGVVRMVELPVIGVGKVVQEGLFVEMWEDDELVLGLWVVFVEETVVFMLENIGEVLFALVLIFTGGVRYWEYMATVHVASWLRVEVRRLICFKQRDFTMTYIQI